jgi:hypothetical protein
MLRISGAIQVLEEVLETAETEPTSDDGETGRKEVSAGS